MITRAIIKKIILNIYEPFIIGGHILSVSHVFTFISSLPDLTAKIINLILQMTGLRFEELHNPIHLRLRSQQVVETKMESVSV